MESWQLMEEAPLVVATSCGEVGETLADDAAAAAAAWWRLVKASVSQESSGEMGDLTAMSRCTSCWCCCWLATGSRASALSAELAPARNELGAGRGAVACEASGCCCCCCWAR